MPAIHYLATSRKDYQRRLLCYRFAFMFHWVVEQSKIASSKDDRQYWTELSLPATSLIWCHTWIPRLLGHITIGNRWLPSYRTIWCQSAANDKSKDTVWLIFLNRNFPEINDSISTKIIFIHLLYYPIISLHDYYMIQLFLNSFKSWQRLIFVGIL